MLTVNMYAKECRGSLAGIRNMERNGVVDGYTRHIRYTYTYTHVDAMILGMLSIRSSFFVHSSFGSPTEYISIVLQNPQHCSTVKHGVIFGVFLAPR